jgi:hypothetical protein
MLIIVRFVLFSFLLSSLAAVVVVPSDDITLGTPHVPVVLLGGGCCCCCCRYGLRDALVRLFGTGIFGKE